MDVLMDTCYVCNGNGEIRGAWDVTYWRMKLCPECDGSGVIEAKSVKAIVEEVLSQDKTLYEHLESREIPDLAQSIIDAMVVRNMFILRYSDLQDIKEEAITKNLESVEDNQDTRDVTFDTINDINQEHIELAARIYGAAGRRLQRSKDSPHARDLIEVAHILDPSLSTDIEEVVFAVVKLDLKLQQGDKE